MSRTSTPGHSSSPFDPYFDPDFTAEITSKMHVPDKICVVEGVESKGAMPLPPEEAKTMMRVPERILVAGDNQHIAVRESVPELKFESAFPIHMPNYILAPPPDILTVNEYPYPTAEFKQQKTEKKSVLDQALAGMNDLNESSMSSSFAPDEEIVILRKQVRHLSRRVLTLEQESQQRQQREIIMYALGVTYFVLKGLVWLHRHF